MAVAQTYHIKQELLSLFEDQSQEIWVTTYLGLEHNAYPVDFLVAKGKTGYRAISYYKDSGDKYYYENNATTDQPGTLAEYDAQGRYTGSVTLHPHVDYIEAVWVSADQNNVMSTILIEDKIGKPTFPALARVLAGRYEGVLFGTVTDFKLYRDRDQLDIHLTSSQGTASLTLLPADFTKTNYGVGSVQILGESLDSLSLTMHSDRVDVHMYQTGTKSTATLDSYSVVTSTQTTWCSPHIRYLLARPEVKGKRLNKWLDERTAVAAEVLPALQAKEANDEYGLLDRNVDWAGMDLQIKYLDSDYLSGDLYIFGPDGLECRSFTYDVSRDQLLTEADVVDRSRLPKDFAEEVTDMPFVMLQDGGLLFQGELDMISGLPRATITYADIAAVDRRILKSKALRNHFLK